MTMKVTRYAIKPPIMAQQMYVNLLDISFGKMRRYSRTIEILVMVTTT